MKDICGDQGVQLHRIQIIAWTVVLAFAYVMHILTKLSVPDFNPTLLGLLGLSAGTYVGFKFPGESVACVYATAVSGASSTGRAGGSRSRGRRRYSESKSGNPWRTEKNQ